MWCRKTQHNRSADIALNAQTNSGADAYAKGLPPEKQEELARRYAELFRVYVNHRSDITRVTFWGVTDGRLMVEFTWTSELPALI